jgi:cytoskeletal protein RodZ
VRRYLAAGIWLALTVAATLIVWAAVSVVAADVTDRPAPVVPHRDVVVALQAGSASSSETTTTASATTTTTRSARPVPATTATPRTPTTSAPGGTGAAGGPAVAAPTTTTVATSAPTTRAPVHPPSPPTTLAPTAGTAAYSNTGGTVAVACSGFNFIRLVTALPNDGFQAVVFSSGPFFVQVNFVGAGGNLPVAAICIFGQPFQIKGTQGG